MIISKKKKISHDNPAELVVGMLMFILKIYKR